MITYTEANDIEKQRFSIGTPPTSPASFYILLSTTEILEDGTGATEPSGGGYARVQVPSNNTYWSSPSSGSISNLVSIDFPKATLDWGTISYVALADSATVGGGNIRYFQNLTNSKIIQQDDVVVFAIGAITITLSN